MELKGTLPAFLCPSKPKHFQPYQALSYFSKNGHTAYLLPTMISFLAFDVRTAPSEPSFTR